MIFWKGVGMGTWCIHSLCGTWMPTRGTNCKGCSQQSDDAENLPLYQEQWCSVDVLDRLTCGKLPSSGLIWMQLCCLVTQLCLTFCESDCSTPVFPVLHHHLELAQTPVHWVGDAIQPSHPLLPAFSSCPQSFLASGSFPVSWLFPQGGQTVWKLQVTSAQLLTCLTFLTKMAVLRLKRAGTV